MLPHDRAQPAAQDKPSWPARIMRWVGRAPLIIKVVLVAAKVNEFQYVTRRLASTLPRPLAKFHVVAPAA